MPSVPMKSVESSNVSKVGYDPQQRKIYAIFASTGETYEYAQAGPNDYAEMLKPGVSIGAYLRAFGKSHPYRKLNPGE